MLRSTAKRFYAWSNVPLAPPDPILGITESYNKDKSPLKVNLGVGAYRDDKGEIYVLNSVKKAEEKCLKMDKEYLPIQGLQSFIDEASKLAYGKYLDRDCLACVQSLSGTGALRLGGELMTRFMNSRDVHIPNPTWGNHSPLFKFSSLEVKNYPYLSADRLTLDLQGMTKYFNELTAGSVVLLHACAHNPTGVDPSEEQWRTIVEIFKKKQLIPFIDMAYQGFSSGSTEKDAFALRLFAEHKIPLMMAQSFAKNMGLYGERIGTFSVLCSSKEQRDAVQSQLKVMIRAMYSNPPLHGARLVSSVLSDPALNEEWRSEIVIMSNRIKSMRKALVTHLSKLSSRDWSHVEKQIGMFCYSGLTEEQVLLMRNKFHIYMTKDGRMSIAGINSQNVEYLAEAIHQVTK